MNNTYILNRKTGKIELHFEKSKYDALPADKKSLLKSNFLFSGKQHQFDESEKIFPAGFCIFQ